MDRSGGSRAGHLELVWGLRGLGAGGASTFGGGRASGRSIVAGSEGEVIEFNLGWGVVFGGAGLLVRGKGAGEGRRGG